MAEAPIVMPKLGLTMSEGLIAEWLVAPGDEVAEGQVLFVVETDKISNEIEAPAAGRITQMLVAAGETVDVGVPVALWTGPGQGVAQEMQRNNQLHTETSFARFINHFHWMIFLTKLQN